MKRSKQNRKTSIGNVVEPFWTAATRNWSSQLPICKITDATVNENEWDVPLKNLGSKQRSWFNVTAKKTALPSSSTQTISDVIANNIILDLNEKQRLIEEKKERRRKKDEERKRLKIEKEGKEYNPKSSKINDNTGRAKKNYEKPVRAKKIKIHVNNEQKETLNQWFGVCRFVYNKCVELCVVAKKQLGKQELRNYFRSPDFEQNYPWFKDAGVPYDVYDCAICDFDKAYRAHLCKEKARKEKEYENTTTSPGLKPGLKKKRKGYLENCKFKFRSKKDRQESFEVRPRDWGRSSGAYAFLFDETKFTTTEEVPLVFNIKTNKRQPENTIRIIRTRKLNSLFLIFPSSHSISSDGPPRNVVAMDPGVRTFQTTYDDGGFMTEWGVNDIARIFSLCKFLDELHSKVESQDLKGSKFKTKRYRIKKAMCRLRLKIRYKVDELHKKLTTWLCRTYKVILIPKFEVSTMVLKSNRRLNKKTVRLMLTWSHYRFRQRLLEKSKLYDHCNVIECDEPYTTRTCGRCGSVRESFWGKIFRCPDCNLVADRDMHAARNILLRYLTINNIERFVN